MVKWSELKRASDIILAVWPHYRPLFERWFMQELVDNDELAPTWRERYVPGDNDAVFSDHYPDREAAVKAADSGTVAAITKSAEGVPIVVIRHPDNLLTVYANVANVSVAKGDSVSKGESIAKLRPGDDSFVHFEVRKGFDSVDPTPYLN